MQRPALFIVLAVLYQILLVPFAFSEPTTISRGDRVRVKSLHLGIDPVEGTVSTIDSDSLTLTPASANQSIALSLREIHSLEIGRGRPSSVGWGAIVGAVVAGAAGAEVGRRECDGDTGLEDLCAPVGAILYAIPGAAIGAVIGLFIRGDERWVQVRLDQIRIGFANDTGTSRVFVSISF